MDYSNMTRKELETLPQRERWNKDIICNSLIILPGKARDLHDSGYRCMDFIAVINGEPKWRLSGCSDVIHIDGIGGYGNNWINNYGVVPKLVVPSGWSIDCLPRSGLLQMWPSSGRIKCGAALSSFEIFSLPPTPGSEKTGEN